MELLTHPDARTKLETIRHRPGFYIVHGASDIGKKTMLQSILPADATQILVPQKATITTAQVREATSDMHLKRTEAAYLIIDDAHTLSEQAQNALLKTLEELPEQATIVMVTDAPQTLVATVRSRSYSIHIPAPADADTMHWLQDRLPAEHSSTLKATLGCRPAALLRCQDEEQLHQQLARARHIEQLFEGALYERLQYARHLTEELPDVLGDITRYVRSQVRRRNDRQWSQALAACEYTLRLQDAHVNKKLLLDEIVLRSYPC